MATPTEIANLALSLIGEPAIASITETTDEASRVCGVNYAQARDECLMLARWSFAKKQSGLSRLGIAPLMDWNAAFQLPTDFIRLCKVAGADVWDQEEYFDVQGTQLFLDVDEDSTAAVNIEYIFRQEDTGTYSPLFVEALSYKLAHKIAPRLTNALGKAKGILEEFERLVLPRCMTVDAQQRYSGENHPLRKIIRRSRLIRSRRSPDDF